LFSPVRGEKRWKEKFFKEPSPLPSPAGGEGRRRKKRI